MSSKVPNSTSSNVKYGAISLGEEVESKSVLSTKESLTKKVASIFARAKEFFKKK